MESHPRRPSFFDQLFERWGQKYIIRIQLCAQAFSIIAAGAGVGYLLLNFSLTPSQVLYLVAAFVILFAIANLILPIFTNQLTKNIRLRLNASNEVAPIDHDIEKAAWQEILLLPRRFAVIEILTALLICVLPVSLIMHYFAGTNLTQTIHVVIAGIISVAILNIQNTIFLDRALAPVRKALLPKEPQMQSLAFGFRIKPRFQIVIGILIAITVLMFGPLGYQKLLNTLAPDTDLATVLRVYQIQLIVIGVLGLLIGLGISVFLASIVSGPILHIIDVINKAEQGDYSERAQIISSDETAELSIRLNNMLDRLQSSRVDLEQKVQERTSELARRVELLQVINQVGRQALTAYDIKTFLAEVVTLISERFGYYHVGIFLIDEMGDYAVLQAASSEGGRMMLERGHRVAVGRQGIVGYAAYQNRPHIALDVGGEAVLFDSPDLPSTRSEAALPLSARGNVIGILDIQSSEPDAFSADDIGLLQAMADQISLATENARLFIEGQNATRQFEATTAEGVRRSWGERVRRQRRAYRYTSQGISTYTPGPGRTGVPASELVTPNRLDIPITLRGQKIGSISLHRKSENPWLEADKDLAIDIANQIGLALENARLLEEAQRRAAQEQSLSELTAKLSRSLDTDTILQAAVRELHQLPNVMDVSVYLVPPEANKDEAS